MLKSIPRQSAVPCTTFDIHSFQVLDQYPQVYPLSRMARAQPSRADRRLFAILSKDGKEGKKRGMRIAGDGLLRYTRQWGVLF